MKKTMKTAGKTSAKTRKSVSKCGSSSKKRRPKWIPTFTIEWVPFSSEEERERAYELWVESFLPD